jgi:hypothetical protein
MADCRQISRQQQPSAESHLGLGWVDRRTIGIMAEPTPANSAETVKNDYMWLALYFLCNLTLTIYNKAVMQFVGFNFPWYGFHKSYRLGISIIMQDAHWNSYIMQCDRMLRLCLLARPFQTSKIRQGRKDCDACFFISLHN